MIARALLAALAFAVAIAAPAQTFQAGKVAFAQQEALSTLKGLIDAKNYTGAVDFLRVPVNSARIGDLAGALNFWAAQQQMPVAVADEFRPGSPRYLFVATSGEIVAIPFTLSRGGQGYASAAEFGGAPALRRAAISATAGDLSGAVTGNQVTIDFNLPPGRYYYNTVLQPGYPPTQSGFSVSFPP